MEDGKAKMIDPSSYDWDDAELIRRYDEGMKEVKKKILGNAKATSSKFQSTPSKGGKNQGSKSAIEWQVGDHCQAVFSEDNLLYEAVIKSVNDDMVLVEFLGYGNEEEVAVAELAPSKGASARHEQIEHAQKDWKIGDYCWAIYEEDSQWYEGKIVKIVDEDTVTVKFLGYGNKEDVPTYNLKPSQRFEAKSRPNFHRGSSVDNYSEENSSLSSQYSSMTNTESYSSQRSSGDHKRLIPRSRRSPTDAEDSFATSHFHNHQMPRHRHGHPGPSNSFLTRRAPSLPPFPIGDDDDTLSALLLSWYMAGYHTGYHMGMRSRSRH